MHPSQVCSGRDQNLPGRIQVKADYLQIHVTRGLAFQNLVIIKIKIVDLLSTLVYIDWYIDLLSQEDFGDARRSHSFRNVTVIRLSITMASQTVMLWCTIHPAPGKEAEASFLMLHLEPSRRI